MGSELVLWQCHLRKFVRSFESGEGKWLFSLVLSAAAALVMIGFYSVGVLTTQRDYAIPLLTLALGLVLATGFFTGIVPIRVNPSFRHLPISQRALLWDEVLTSFRLPILVTLVMIVPFYIGASINQYYTWTDYVLLILGMTLVLGSIHGAANGVAQLLKPLTNHSFIRLLIIVAALIIGIKFISQPNSVTTAIESSFNSVTFAEISLVILGSIGILGTAVVLIEAVKPVFSTRAHSSFWSFLTHHRNFRSVSSLGESAFIATFLFGLRNAKLHTNLAVTLVAFLIVVRLGYAISVATPIIPYIILAVTFGALGYYVSFAVGQRDAQAKRTFFYRPVNFSQSTRGSFVASGIISLLLASLAITITLESLKLAGPVVFTTLLLIMFAIHCLAYSAGQYTGERPTNQVNPEGYGVFLTLMAVISTVSLFPFFSQANPSLLLLVTTLWLLTYSFGSQWLFRRSRA